MAKTSRKVDGRPSWQWYSDDWLAESGLRLCSLSARGLWIDLLCHAFKMEKRGHLWVNGRNLGSKEIAALVGREEAEVKQSLSELDLYGVSETTDDGCIYNRRMVRDEEQRQSKIKAGRKGGLSSKGASKTQAKGGPSTPSSSSSPTPSTLKPKKELLKRFDIFWAAYPKRRARGRAEKAFAKIKPDEQLLTSMLATLVQAKNSKQWKNDGGDYIPLPATWLNDKGWEDDWQDKALVEDKARSDAIEAELRKEAARG